jgi:hypothetical protein
MSLVFFFFMLWNMGEAHVPQHKEKLWRGVAARIRTRKDEAFENQTLTKSSNVPERAPRREKQDG